MLIPVLEEPLHQNKASWLNLSSEWAWSRFYIQIHCFFLLVALASFYIIHSLVNLIHDDSYRFITFIAQCTVHYCTIIAQLCTLYVGLVAFAVPKTAFLAVTV